MCSILNIAVSNHAQAKFDVNEVDQI